MVITKEGYAIIERDSHLGKWVVEHARIDFDHNALPAYLPYFKGGTFVNIGANIGCYAYPFALLADIVICYEPNPEAFSCLKHNMSGFKNVILRNDALSDHSFHYSVTTPNDNIGMAFIEQKTEGKLTKSLDREEIPSCDFLLMDCEGHELKVLIGGEQTINKYRPIMVIEINDHTLRRTNTTRDQIFDWLTDHKYTFRNIYAEQGLGDDQLDIICFPSK